ncbi:hypothetical protein FH972_022435 [Carpinus fangiana]|uniref:V-SNARE coiled-coil homology domain-containing protein n=1 Tax=Carpinus fangiana TaxID=176857 RepID=A0A5N6KS92_9ROSI|nr:hypothetical protein FH972_022435 [Carpinus fangiana]
MVMVHIDHSKSQKLTYTHNDNLIHYIADAPSDHAAPADPSAGGLTFLVIARADLGRRVPFGYLVEIRRRFLQQYDASRTDFASLPPYGAAAFNGKLKDLMHEYGSTQAGRDDAMSKAQREIEDVKGIMTENIERVLERGERIDLLVDKTDRLGGSARDFRVRSRGLRRKMWWKNVKLMALLIVVVIFLIYLFVGFGCGLPGTIVSVGAGGTIPPSLKPNTRVAYAAQAAYAEYTAMPALHVFALPDSVDNETAAAGLLQGLTAITLIREAHHVNKGDWVLVHAAAGGMGLWLCQLLRVVGAHVIATASTPEKRALAEKNGAEVTLEYAETIGNEAFVKKVTELTSGNGVVAVFDGVG